MRKLGSETYLQMDGLYAPTRVRIVSISRVTGLYDEPETDEDGKIVRKWRWLNYEVELLEDFKRPNGQVISLKGEKRTVGPLLLRDKLTASAKKLREANPNG